ncbi:unnamed protein product [Pieris brassicae]|uniref:Uncharacterized protein n=1 Tax=Pieris brassicae TaxID=7116 RepID=A0A9P0SPF8_PIEBR|nr:unnamed protein product [Pieris brassicae]
MTVFGVRGGSAGQVVEEVEGGHSGSLGLSESHEEVSTAEDGGPSQAQLPHHAHASAALSRRYARPGS